MADLDVALRLRLINGLKAGATDAKRDLAGVGAAAKNLAQARGFNALSRDLEGASARAKRLERQLAALRSARGFGGLGTSFDGTAAGAQRAARFAARLASSIEKAQGPAAGLRREYEGIAAAAERAARVGAALRRVAAREGRLGTGPAGQGGYRAGPDGSAAAAGLAGRVAFGPGTLGGAGAAITAHQIAGQAVKSFATLETAAKQLAITAGKSDEDVAKVVEQYRKLGPAMGVSAKEMVEAAQAFVAAGLDFDTAVAAVPSAVKTAKASFGEVGDTAKAGIAAINNLGIPVEQLSEAFDRMAKAGKEGNVELKDLARLLPEVAAGGSAIGLEGLSGLTDLVAALEVIGKVAATPGEAATKLKDLMGKATADETARAFKKVGEAMGRVVDIEKEMNEGAKRGENKLAVILRLTKDLTNGDPFRIGELFGDKEAREAIVALMKFEADYNAIRERINSGSKGMIDADFKNATARLAADFERMGAAWDRLMGRMGEAAAPGLGALTKEATGFLERMEQGDTILQRIVKRMGLDQADEATKKSLEDAFNGQGSLEKWFEEKFSLLSGKRWNEEIDKQIGKTGREAGDLRERDVYRRRAEEDAAKRRLPDEIRAQIARMERALEQARGTADGASGPQAEIARGQVPKREADIARLKGELDRATAAVAAMEEARREEVAKLKELAASVQSLARLRGFGQDGPRGTKSEPGSGLGAFGFGRYGTKDLPGPAVEPGEAPSSPEPAAAPDAKAEPEAKKQARREQAHKAPPGKIEAEPGPKREEPEAKAAPKPQKRARPDQAHKAPPEKVKVEIAVEAQDFSEAATKSMETYRQALKAGIASATADAVAGAARIKAALSFHATPTITVTARGLVPSSPGGGGAAPAPTPARARGPAPGGGGGEAPIVRSASLRRRGGDSYAFNGPIHVHGVRDVASLQRGLQREAGRAVRDARNDALHDTGSDFA